MHELIDTDTPTLAGICALQAAMQSLPQLDMPVTHHFAPHVYARELFMPAGSALVGKMHATEHLLILASGDVTVVSDGKRERLQGPLVLRTLPGTKRAIQAHTDATLITIHPTESTDLVQIEADIILPDPLDLIEGDIA